MAKKKKKKKSAILKLGKTDFYVMLAVIIVIVICVAYIGTLLAIKFVFYPDVSFKESSSIEIKEIVANTTACCFTNRGCWSNSWYSQDYCVAKRLYDWVDENVNYTHQMGLLSPQGRCN